DLSANQQVDYFNADIAGANDYYPFGMEMLGRSFNPSEYRFGFNGQEKDDEICGNGNSYTAEFWQYDPRLGRRWNIDPVDKPWMSSYHAFSNKPILNIDPNGALDDDVFKNSETGETTIVKTDDNFDREFVDGVEVGKHNQGWGVENYGNNSKIIDLGSEWNSEYLYDGGKVVGIAAFRSGSLWSTKEDTETKATKFEFGIVDLGGGFENSGFYQSKYTDFAPYEGYKTGYALDGDERGIYPDERHPLAIGKNTTGIPFDLFMADQPTRTQSNPENMVWEGNTSFLYKPSSKEIQNLITLKWGFTVNNNVIDRSRAKVTNNPSEYHFDNLPKSGRVSPKTITK
ncbi:MAG: hypothetical protein U9N54_10490, partial [candidate division Zixibacteria bacterium]|nr:hypothetical protein [candidate division Zixibacteria bacterium]